MTIEEQNQITEAFMKDFLDLLRQSAGGLK